PRPAPGQLTYRDAAAADVDTLLARGHVEEAREAAERYAFAPPYASSLAIPDARSVRGRLLLALGRTEEAITELEATGRALTLRGRHNGVVAPWAIDLARALADVNPERAAELAAYARDRAERFGTHTAIGVALCCSASLTDGPAAVDLLAEAVTHLEASPCTYELAVARVEYGIAARSAPDLGRGRVLAQVLYTHLARELNGAKSVPGRHTRVDGDDQVDKVVHVDQSPIGRTPRSNPATYTGVFDHVRKLFAETMEAKVRGYLPGRFSFNVKGGRCENCAGDGTIKIEMNFLPDVYVPCEVCHGARYNRETLEVHYKGKSIAEVLDMPIEEGLDFFEAVPTISRHLKTLNEVGLGYVRLGQSAPTLSGGEAQRVKLASELQKRSTGRTVYVLDEPTTGLHFDDISKLINVLSGLVDKGNTVIVIEHNLDVIKTADWVVDMGPEGGNGGGLVVAEGTPEEVAGVATSHTGKFLREILDAERISDATPSGRTKSPARKTAAKTATKTAAKATATASGKKTATKTAATKTAARSPKS
ncbi:hypothetical protein AB0R12_40310, partial [Streptomyces niveus]